MQRAVRVLPPAAVVPERIVDRVRLDHQARHRRRLRLQSEGGLLFLLDLPATQRLRHGEGLELEDGGLVLVEAAPEPLLEVRAPTPAALLRLAWHLGNRHLPAQLQEERILIRPDHVIRAMLEGLGGTVRAVAAPFDPEGGAYESGHAHAHAPAGR